MFIKNCSYIYIYCWNTHTHTHNQTNSGWKDIPVIFHVNVCISILYLSFRKKYKFPYTRIGEYDVALAEQLQREKAEKQNAVRGKYWCLSVCLSVLLAVICCHNFVRAVFIMYLNIQNITWCTFICGLLQFIFHPNISLLFVTPIFMVGATGGVGYAHLSWTPDITGIFSDLCCVHSWKWQSSYR